MNSFDESYRFRSVGQDVIIWPMAKVINSKDISIGDSVIIDDFVLLIGGGNTEIGSFVHLASFISITGGGEFIIENFSNIATGSRIREATTLVITAAMPRCQPAR